MHRKKSNFGALEWFLIICNVATLIYLTYIFFTRSSGLNSLVWNGETTAIFPDFFESVRDSTMRRPYNTSAIYPPFIYCILYAFSRIIPGDSYNWEATASSPVAQAVAYIFFLTMTLVILLLIYNKLELKSIWCFLFAMVLFFSPGFIYMFERGNMVMLAVIFLSVFCFYYRSSNPVLREIALISLVICVCLKMYPAVFGLLLLLDKRFKEAIRCIIYGIVLFFVPFVFMGGIGGTKSFINNIVSLSLETVKDERNFGLGYKVNVSNIVAFFEEAFGFSRNSSLETGLVVATFVLIIIAAIIAPKVWQKIFALSLCLTLIPGFSWIYNNLYLLVPLVMFFYERPNFSGKNIVYTLLFCLMMTSFPYGYVRTDLPGVNSMSITVLVSFFAQFIMLVFIIIDSVQGFASKRKNVEAETV